MSAEAVLDDGRVIVAFETVHCVSCGVRSQGMETAAEHALFSHSNGGVYSPPQGVDAVPSVVQLEFQVTVTMYEKQKETTK